MNNTTADQITTGAQFVVTVGTAAGILTIDSVHPYYGVKFFPERADWRTVKSDGRFYNISPAHIL